MDTGKNPLGHHLPNKNLPQTLYRSFQEQYSRLQKIVIAGNDNAHNTVAILLKKCCRNILMLLVTVHITRWFRPGADLIL